MKRKTIIGIICFFVLVLIYLSYGRYKNLQYANNAKAYKEYIFTATELAKHVIERTDELMTKSSIIKRKHETTYYKNKEEATNYGCIVLQHIMDNKWQIDDMKKYSKVVWDSCMREANVCLNRMRDYSDCYPYDHQSFETALKTLRPIVRQYEDETFSKEFYKSSMKDIQSIYNCLSESDVNFGEINVDVRKRVKYMANDIIRKSYHGKPGVEESLELRYGVFY